MKKYKYEAAKQLVALAELCSAMCRLCSLPQSDDGFEEGLDHVEEMMDLMDGYDQCEELRIIFQAKIDVNRLRSLDAKRRGDYECAVMLQECVVDAFEELEGESMRSSDELWRLSKLHFSFGDIKLGIEIGKKSIRIADTLRGRQDPTDRMRKSDLDKKTKCLSSCWAPNN